MSTALTILSMCGQKNCFVIRMEETNQEISPPCDPSDRCPIQTTMTPGGFGEVFIQLSKYHAIIDTMPAYRIVRTLRVLHLKCPRASGSLGNLYIAHTAKTP